MNEEIRGGESLEYCRVQFEGDSGVLPGSDPEHWCLARRIVSRQETRNARFSLKHATIDMVIDAQSTIGPTRRLSGTDRSKLYKQIIDADDMKDASLDKTTTTTPETVTPTLTYYLHITNTFIIVKKTKIDEDEETGTRN
jgi:hypothetical protein